MTRKYHIWSIIFWILGALCFIAPMVSYVIIGYISFQDNNHMLLICGLLAFVVFIIDCFRHAKSRVSTWLLLTGLVFVANLSTIQLAVSITMIGVFLDSLIFTPLYNYCRNKYVINKEIDKRGIHHGRQ